jgi:hypothetical protein
MAKLKISDEWWTSPAETDNGKSIIVTGRRNMEPVMATGKYNDRVEVTWKYEGDGRGLPDEKTSKIMGQVHDAFVTEFEKDPVAVLTGIYTGDGERNWVLYTQSTHIFERKFNEALAEFPLLPISIYVEHDPEWKEYREMRENTEIMEGE